MTNNRMILIGAGGFGREVLSWIHHADISSNMPYYYIDDNGPVLNDDYSCEYLGSIKEFKVSPSDRFLLCIGSPDSKKFIHSIFHKYVDQFITFIHPSAIVAKTAKIGRGVIICPFTVISADTKISDFVTVNVMSSIGHDSNIGQFSTLSAHVDITGGVEIGDEVFCGTGAKIVPKIKIGNQAKIGAGCTVIRSVPAKTTLFTQHAKKLF